MINGVSEFGLQLTTRRKSSHRLSENRGEQGARGQGMDPVSAMQVVR